MISKGHRQPRLFRLDGSFATSEALDISRYLNEHGYVTPVNPTEAHVITFTERLLLQHGLVGWTVKLDRATSRAGQCRHAEKVISLSRPLIKARGIDKALMTAKHEVAHALVGGHHGHDVVWRLKFIELGGDGNAQFVLEDSASERLTTKYLGVCPSGHKEAMARRPKRRRSCVKCNPKRFDERYVLSVTERATGKVVGYAEAKPVKKVNIRLADGRVLRVPARF